MTLFHSSGWVVEQARAAGFDLCGVVHPAAFPEFEHFAEWLGRGDAGEMRYMQDPRRFSVESVLPGAKSVIVCGLNYNTQHPHSTEAPAATAGDAPRGWISRYAWGSDYHNVIGRMLNTLLAGLRGRVTVPFEAHAYVDAGPVPERIFAKYAGLGWLGKNTCLIHERLGSWLFLGVLLTSLDLAPSLAPGESPPPDLCGNCRMCLDACPTGALTEAYVLDARRCISYLTIELRGPIPEELRAPMGRHVFGCDICQDVCPWNRNAPTTSLAVFAPRRPAEDRDAPSKQSGFLPDLEWLASLSEAEFRVFFRESAVKRTKWRGLVRNACVALGNSELPRATEARERIRSLLERLAHSAEPLVAEHAAWALRRLFPP